MKILLFNYNNYYYNNYYYNNYYYNDYHFNNAFFFASEKNARFINQNLFKKMLNLQNL